MAGGNGGANNTGGGGGQGGQTRLVTAGDDGLPGQNSGGGGGGGAGTIGGAGANGSALFGTFGAGGAGATSASVAGTDGGSGQAGGGGGGGGAHGSVITTSTALPASTNVRGSDGGAGGDTTDGFGGGAGGGGAGGYGVVINGTGLSLQVLSGASVAGAAGGRGGSDIPGPGAHGLPGSGGAGGTGVNAGDGNSVSNVGSIAGGNGGAGGTGTRGTGSAGGGGAGISGSNLTITNSGSISGGMDGTGIVQADAITFTGGANRLTTNLNTTTNALGAYSGTLSVASGGSLILDQTTAAGANANATYSNAITGAGDLISRSDGGRSVILTGANTYTGSTTITAGTLALSGSASIASSNSVAVSSTFDISQTAIGASIKDLSGSGSVKLGARTLTVTNALSTFSGIISDGGITNGTAGTLQLNGGTLTLSGNNTYTGITFVNPISTLKLSGSGSVSSSSLVSLNGTFDVSGITNNSTRFTNLTGGGTLALDHKGVELTAATGIFSGTITGQTDSSLTISGGVESLSNLSPNFHGSIALAANTRLNLIQSTSAGDGTLTFGSGAQTLALSLVGTLAVELAAFGIEDTIDLRGIPSSSASASFNANTHDLTVTGGGQSNILHFDPGYTLPSGYQFTTAADGTGGTNIKLTVIPPSSGGGTPPTYSNPSEFGMTVTSSASPAGAVYGLYKALLGHTPDPLGLEAFAGSIQNGATPADVAAAILTSPEYTARNPNPLTDSAYVSSLYTSLLNRAPDAQGQAYFQGELSAGVSRATVASQIATSTEAQNVLQPTFANGVFVTNATDAQIARLYYGILGRTPDANGLASFEAQAKGLGLAGIAQTMLSSSEFGAKFGNLSDAAYIDTLYVDALGHHADAAALSYWGSQLPAQGRVQVAVQIAQSQEAQVHLVGVIEQGMQVTA